MKVVYDDIFGKIICGDCVVEMTNLMKAGTKVDMVLVDMPYGTTKCAWDSVIPMGPVWVLLDRLVRKDGACVFTATQPFTSYLVSSKPEWFAYDWVWKKPHTGQLDAKRKPLRNKEDILVFCTGGKTPRYFPQKHPGKPYANHRRRGVNFPECYGSQRAHDVVNPTGARFPMQIIEFTTKEKRLHPTQKPVELIKYLIQTYTELGETVLDFTCGSGTTAIAAIETGRKFICIDNNLDFCGMAVERINETIINQFMV